MDYIIIGSVCAAVLIFITYLQARSNKKKGRTDGRQSFTVIEFRRRRRRD